MPNAYLELTDRDLLRRFTAHGDQTEIANARREFDRGVSDLATTRPDRYESAIDHYREAWRHAMKALGRL